MASYLWVKEEWGIEAFREHARCYTITDQFSDEEIDEVFENLVDIHGEEACEVDIIALFIDLTPKDKENEDEDEDDY